MTGRVVKNIADKFSVVSETGEVFENCVARGNLKSNGKLLVGDNCDFEVIGNSCVITKIQKRKNQFIRPLVANIDAMLLVVSQVPQIDYLLLDKLILNCKIKNVEPIIVVNKQDVISEDFVLEVERIYAKSGVKIVQTSALNGNGESELVELIKGKLACLSGQSAVGKSSLLNMLVGANVEVGELSKKIERGKNTTRHAEIYFEKEKNIFIIDTAGFSKFDAIDVSYNKIELYYAEFDGLREQCFYSPCSHIFEKDEDCAVKSALNCCQIDKNRYNNYKIIYQKIKSDWENRYE